MLTLAAPQGEVAAALVDCAREAVRRIDLRSHRGVHPHVGALDVAPVVYLEPPQRGPATAEALTAAGLIAEELELPTFLYGELATSEAHRERASLRSGGPRRLAERMASGELQPDFGPRRADPAAGAVLVTARPPLVALNIDLASDDVELARRIAAELRESRGGFRGVRAIGLLLPSRGRAQVSLNVHDHREAPLWAIVAAVRARAEVAETEIVGLVPGEALEGVASQVPIRGFDPERQLIPKPLR